MLAIIGALSVVAGTALLRYAMIANQRTPRPAWTSNWVVNGAMAPAVITLYAVGIILIIQFALDFSGGTIPLVEAIVTVALLATNFLVWRSWRPKAGPQHAPSPNVVPGGTPSPAAGGGRNRKKAA